MIVKVMQRHIDKGIGGDCGKCPIALALLDVGFTHVDVDTNNIMINYKDKTYYIDLPDEAVEFIERFDNELPVNPFSFSIDLK